MYRREQGMKGDGLGAGDSPSTPVLVFFFFVPNFSVRGKLPNLICHGDF